MTDNAQLQTNNKESCVLQWLFDQQIVSCGCGTVQEGDCIKKDMNTARLVKNSVVDFYRLSQVWKNSDIYFSVIFFPERITYKFIN